MTRSNQRFTLALAILTLDALLMASLVYLSLQGKGVSGESVLFMAAGMVLGWGSSVVGFYYATSDSSIHKTELMADRPSGNPGDPVSVSEEG